MYPFTSITPMKSYTKRGNIKRRVCLHIPKNIEEFLLWCLYLTPTSSSKFSSPFFYTFCLKFNVVTGEIFNQVCKFRYSKPSCSFTHPICTQGSFIVHRTLYNNKISISGQV